MTLAQGPYGFSPDSHSSSPDAHAGSLLFDDDAKDGLLFPDGEDDDDLKPLPSSAAPKRSNGRKGPEAAGKRAQHNAIERARRESLNGRFMTLAEALPTMASVKRPSKSIIVNKALDFVFDAQVKEHALIKENNDLRRQVDQLRARLGMPPLPPPTPLPAAAAGSRASVPAPQPQQPASIAPQQLLHQQQQQQQYHTSFASAENYSDEMASAMGGTTGSPASASPVSPASNVSSPAINYLSSSIEELAAGSPSSVSAPSSMSSASPAPYVTAAMSMMPFGGMGMGMMPPVSAAGYMNPALLQQQHAMMLAMQQQHQQQGHAHGMDMYGWNAYAQQPEQFMTPFMA